MSEAAPSYEQTPTSERPPLKDVLVAGKRLTPETDPIPDIQHDQEPGTSSEVSKSLKQLKLEGERARLTQELAAEYSARKFDVIKAVNDPKEMNEQLEELDKQQAAERRELEMSYIADGLEPSEEFAKAQRVDELHAIIGAYDDGVSKSKPPREAMVEALRKSGSSEFTYKELVEMPNSDIIVFIENARGELQELTSLDKTEALEQANDEHALHDPKGEKWDESGRVKDVEEALPQAYDNWQDREGYSYDKTKGLLSEDEAWDPAHAEHIDYLNRENEQLDKENDILHEEAEGYKAQLKENEDRHQGLLEDPEALREALGEHTRVHDKEEARRLADEEASERQGRVRKAYDRLGRLFAGKKFGRSGMERLQSKDRKDKRRKGIVAGLGMVAVAAGIFAFVAGDSADRDKPPKQDKGTSTLEDGGRQLAEDEMRSIRENPATYEQLTVNPGDFPWDVVARAKGREHAMEDLRKAGAAAAKDDHEVKWAKLPNGRLMVIVDGETDTKKVMGTLGQYLPR